VQHLNYDPSFPATVLDVVLMGRVERHAIGPYRAPDRRAAFAALEQVDLQDMASRPFPGLSGGQRQRALIAQALVSGPELLFLDEPTANVDAAGERKVFELLARLGGRLTILVVSHNVNVVLAAASHVLCVNKTAVLNRIDDMRAQQLTGSESGEMALLRHDLSCHVFDASRAMREPHTASSARPGQGTG
jgi:zinc transport system ATP-binding protein